HQRNFRSIQTTIRSTKEISAPFNPRFAPTKKFSLHSTHDSLQQRNFRSIQPAIWTYVKKVDSTFSLNEPFFLLPHDSFRVVWIPLCNGTNQKPIPSITQRFSALQ